MVTFLKYKRYLSEGKKKGDRGQGLPSPLHVFEPNLNIAFCLSGNLENWLYHNICYKRAIFDKYPSISAV